MFDRALNRNRKKVIESIQEYLSTGKSAVVHFLCYLRSSRGIRHEILISLFKNSTGRALYMFDNMNDPCTQSVESAQFIDYLCKIFKVSKRSEFNSPKLPHRWHSLDR